MGLTDKEAAEQKRRLESAQQAEAKPERGHRRGKTVVHQVGGSPELRGVPLIGTGPGGLANTRPGGELGRVDALEKEAHDLYEQGRRIVRRHRKRHQKQAEQKPDA